MTVKDRARYCAWLVVAGLATYLMHEGAHWLAGVALGHEMLFGLNVVRPVEAVPLRDATLISVAGPAFTFIQGIVAFTVFRRTRSVPALALLLWAAFMRLIAWGISWLSAPNDEARVGIATGVGPWALHALISIPLVVLAVLAIRQRRSDRWELAMTYVVLSLVSTAVVMADLRAS